MKFRASIARAVHPELMLDTSGNLVRGTNFRLRRALVEDDSIRGFDHTPEDDFNLLEFSGGQYARLCESRYFDIYKNGVKDANLSPIFIADNNDFTSGGTVGVPNGWFGDGSDGDVTLPAGVTTLARDMFYNNLTVPSGAILVSGYRIFVKGILTLNGVIHNNGGNGGSGADGTFSIVNPCPGSLGNPLGGLGGTSAQAGYFLADAGAGVNGANGEDINNSGATPDGTTGALVSFTIGSAGIAGSGGGKSGVGSQGGGRGPSLGGLAGGIVALTAPSGAVRSFFHLALGRALSLSGTQSAFNINGTSGGAGGGCHGQGGCVYCPSVGTGGSGGAGGGNGANGGIVSVIATSVKGSGAIQARGGSGGNGGKGGDGQQFTCPAQPLRYSGAGGGGGGGNGGNGGAVIFIAYDKTGFNGTVDANFGVAGFGGTNGQNPMQAITDGVQLATAGQAGANGINGLTFQLLAI